MISPTNTEELKLYKQGYKLVAGIDEAGRGAWAGPVVAACVILPSECKIDGVRDSKLLSPKQRDKIFNEILKKALAVGIGMNTETQIDKYGIFQATKNAMRIAVENMELKPDFLLVDAFDLKKTVDIPSKGIIKGDMKVFSIAAASIVAKVARDRFLVKQHKIYSLYGFKEHKGYGTEKHRKMIEKYGICWLHRRSYKPIKRFNQKSTIQILNNFKRYN